MEPARIYQPRRARETLLYRIVAEQLDELLERCADSYAKPLPRYVVDELRGFLKCGQLEHGFLRCRCDDCGHEFLVPFSCSNRGICPSCTTRRMSNTAAHLVDRVLPNLPIRQWVLSLPFELRLLAARRPDVLSAMGRIFVQEIFRRHRAATGLAGSLAGAVSFTHRAGGSLNLNPHHHVPVLDGVFVERSSAGVGALDFIEVPAPTNGELQALAERVHRRAVRWLGRRGYLAEHGTGDSAVDLEQLSAVDALARFALSGGGYERLDDAGAAQTMGERWSEPRRTGPMTADCMGFNVNASVWIARDDDEGRERLMRYGSRPAFAAERLSLLDDGRVAYRIRYARRGSTHRVMTQVELLARLAALIPPPRHPLTRYFGVLSSHSKHRPRVVPRLPTASPRPHVRHGSSASPALRAPSTRASASPAQTSAPPDHSDSPASLDGSTAATTATGRSTTAGPVAAPGDTPCQSGADDRYPALEAEYNVITIAHLDRLLGGELMATSPRLDWARLLRRSMAIDPFCCPLCGARMRPMAEITDPDVIGRILDHLATRNPRASPAPKPPTLDGALATVH